MVRLRQLPHRGHCANSRIVNPQQCSEPAERLEIYYESRIYRSRYRNGTFGRHLINAGHTVVVSNSSGPATLAGFVADLGPGAIAGTREEAAECDVVILAVHWVNVREALKGIDWRGRILIDATNAHMDPKPDISLAGVTRSRAALKGRTSSEMVAENGGWRTACKIDQQHADGLDTGLLAEQTLFRHLYIRRRHRSQTASNRIDQQHWIGRD